MKVVDFVAGYVNAALSRSLVLKSPWHPMSSVKVLFSIWSACEVSIRRQYQLDEVVDTLLLLGMVFSFLAACLVCDNIVMVSAHTVCE